LVPKLAEERKGVERGGEDKDSRRHAMAKGGMLTG
jgi:hypothetical protein